VKKKPIPLPREIRRRRMKADEGDPIAFIIDGEQVVIKPITQTLLDLRGSVPVSGEQDFDAIRKQVIAGRAKRGSETGSL
jgi:bifunctional DNA-binding transcriptional regulator/antitoxin component of YhaV-PrlF toxin-antitoxin module